MDKLFIPKRLRVGFHHRSDTYTKKLAYVIYYDEKGKLRKETSWEGWRDKKIEPRDVENVPHSGFVLNKDVQRYGYWGNGRNMIRVYDDRGIEFEITTDNLMFILMTTDCLKRGLVGEFVYAWSGKELILLPTGCEEYQESTKFTAARDGKVTAKELVPGAIYQTKQMEKVIYMGEFPWKTNDYSRAADYRKQHIFYRISSERRISSHFTEMGTDSLSGMIDPGPVENYASLREQLASHPDGQLISLNPGSVSFHTVEKRIQRYTHSKPKGKEYLEHSGEKPSYSSHYYNGIQPFYVEESPGKYRVFRGEIIRKDVTHRPDGRYVGYEQWEIEGVRLTSSRTVTITDGVPTSKSSTFKDEKLYSLQEIEAMRPVVFRSPIGGKNKIINI